MSAVAIGLTMLTIGALLITQLATAFINPLAALASGIALDLGIDWLIRQTQECQ